MSHCKKPWTTADIPPQTGKVALVTGATGGLGYEIALELSRAGATVIVAGRNEEKGKDALEKILAACPEAKLQFGKVNLGSLASVKEFAANISGNYKCLDILINNAGVMTPQKKTLTEDGFEIQFGTNYLSHFALTAHLLPLLQKSSAPRVITVGALAHRQGKINFDDLQSEKCSYGWNVYSQSKLANHLFAFELQKKSDARNWGITSIIGHPGICKTDLMANGPGEVGVTGWIATRIVRPLMFGTAQGGALPILYAATSPEAKGGDHYGPNGFYEIKGAVAPAYSAPTSMDPNVATKLWDVAVNLTGVTWP